MSFDLPAVEAALTRIINRFPAPTQRKVPNRSNVSASLILNERRPDPEYAYIPMIAEPSNHAWLAHTKLERDCIADLHLVRAEIQRSMPILYQRGWEAKLELRGAIDKPKMVFSISQVNIAPRPVTAGKVARNLANLAAFLGQTAPLGSDARVFQIHGETIFAQSPRDAILFHIATQSPEKPQEALTASDDIPVFEKIDASGALAALKQGLAA